MKARGPGTFPGPGTDGRQGGESRLLQSPGSGSMMMQSPILGNRKAHNGRPRGPSLEEIFRRGGGKGGGGFGGLPPRADGKSWWPIITGGLVAALAVDEHPPPRARTGRCCHDLWQIFATPLGRALPLPARFPDPAAAKGRHLANSHNLNRFGQIAVSENLVLTKDQNLIDMAYRHPLVDQEPELYLFQLDDPEQHCARSRRKRDARRPWPISTLTQAIGDGVPKSKARCWKRMQAILDEYRSGVLVRAFRSASPTRPAEVKDAFREVNAAQQRAKAISTKRAPMPAK
jgi:membrane protease subunit HflK